MIQQNTMTKLTETIKIELRTQKVTQRQFAVMLGVSEPTVKRWLTGQGVLLENWVRMLEVLGLSFVDIAARLNEVQTDSFTYSEHQEAMFLKTPGLLAFYEQLRRGKSPKKIMSEKKLSEKTVIFHIRKLDDLGLIRWETNLNVRLIDNKEPHWRKDGELSKAFKKASVSQLVHQAQDSNAIKMGLYNLTGEAMAQINEMFKEIQEYARISEQRSQIEGLKTKEVGILLLQDEYSPKFLNEIPERTTSRL